MKLFETPNNSTGGFAILKETQTYLPQVHEFDSLGNRLTADINYRLIVYKDLQNDEIYTRITYGWLAKWYFGDKTISSGSYDYSYGTAADYAAVFATPGFKEYDFTPQLAGVKSIYQVLGIYCVGGVPALDIVFNPTVLTFTGVSTKTLEIQLTPDCLYTNISIDIDTLPPGVTVRESVPLQVQPVNHSVYFTFDYDNSDPFANGSYQTVIFRFSGGSPDFVEQAIGLSFSLNAN